MFSAKFQGFPPGLNVLNSYQSTHYMTFFVMTVMNNKVLSHEKTEIDKHCQKQFELFIAFFVLKLNM